MGKYAFYGYLDDTMRPLGVDPIPVPVRPEREKEVFGGESVQVDLLLQELELFLAEYPDLGGLYAGTVEILTWLAGVEAGTKGDAQTAERFMKMGLEANPGSLLLRSNYALALQLQGRSDEALEQYELVLADPEGRKNPMVCLLAARLYAEQVEYLKAYRLLGEMAKELPADDAFLGFLAKMKELSGLEDKDSKREEEPRRDAFCTGCGNPLKEGLAFCNKCGKQVGGAGKQTKDSCISCGNPLKEGQAFCNKCGKPV